MAPLSALISVLVAATVPAAPGRVAVRVVSDMGRCPAPAEVQSAVGQVLGDSEQDAGGWTLWYGRDPAASGAEREASLLMELADPAGERLASRRIPTLAGDCAAIGTAMAAVVERTLRDLGWTRGDPLPESAGSSRAGVGPAVHDDEAGTEQRAGATEAVAGKRGPRLLLGAGPMFGTSSRVGMNLLVDARVRVAGPFGVRLGAAVLAGSDSESLPSAGNGQVSLSSRTFSVSPLGAFVMGPVETAAGPVVWLAADKASSSELPKAGSGGRMVMAVGAGIGIALPLSRRWRIALAMEGVRVAFAAETYVDWNGTKITVLAPPPWQGMAAATLEFVPWP